MDNAWNLPPSAELSSPHPNEEDPRLNHSFLLGRNGQLARIAIEEGLRRRRRPCASTPLANSRHASPSFGRCTYYPVLQQENRRPDWPKNCSTQRRSSALSQCGDLLAPATRLGKISIL